jgi:hypothetical protein
VWLSLLCLAFAIISDACLTSRFKTSFMEIVVADEAGGGLQSLHPNSSRVVEQSLSQTFSSPLLPSAAEKSLRPLKLLLRAMGLPPNPDSSRVPFYIICSLMWAMTIAVIIYSLYLVSAGDVDSDLSWAITANHIWMIHSALTYTIVGYSLHRGPRCALSVVRNTIEYATSSRISGPRNSFLSFNEDLMSKMATFCSIAVFMLAMLNLIVVSIVFFSGFNLLPVTRDVWWPMMGACLWYFLSYGWAISIAFVAFPILIIAARVTEFVEYFESLNARADPDVDRLMAWYDDLYDANTALCGTSALLLTVDVVILFPLTIFLLLVCCSFIP